MEADGAPFIPLPLTVLRFLSIWKATRIRGKSKQTFKSPRIELGTSRSESSTLANWATTGPRLLHKGKAGFRREGKTGIPGGKRLRAEKRTNKLNPHMTTSLEIEPGPHWCDANSLTTTPPLHRWDAVSFQLCWHLRKDLYRFQPYKICSW